MELIQQIMNGYVEIYYQDVYHYDIKEFVDDHEMIVVEILDDYDNFFFTININDVNNAHVLVLMLAVLYKKLYKFALLYNKCHESFIADICAFVLKNKNYEIKSFINLKDLEGYVEDDKIRAVLQSIS